MDLKPFVKISFKKLFLKNYLKMKGTANLNKMINLINELEVNPLNGKIATNKGYFAGLKVGGLFLLLLIIINLFTNKNIFRISTLIYYLVLVLASVFGGMLGINKKEEK